VGLSLVLSKKVLYFFCGGFLLQNVYAPEDDPMMTVEEYERSYEQNEELGLNDMKTEEYS
jgi:hypothetical protein